MNTYKYDPITNAFYPYSMKDSYIATGSWPDDGVDVTEDIYNEFSNQPPTGKVRITDDNGMPDWGDVPPLTHEELIQQAATKKQQLIEQANDYMGRKQWPGKAAIGRLKGDELNQYNLWLDYLDELDAVITADPLEIMWPVSPGG
ncbi:tail fiber assembly protein [Enterobacter kobei]|uniref:Tail fiber assembly protein n=2 Tax=Enterobacter kobei TaxID=208224 RepID=A0AA86IPV2_9ENTR|nr:tail fiber assembly protein [Enterobacter kobei]OLR21755.1 tail fiber assembly protein [Enterobacter kobei]BCU55310.1 hypothetical protein ENKO_19040 [Enterobacter kobei]